MTPMCLLNAKDRLKLSFSILEGSSSCKVHVDAEFQYCCYFAWEEANMYEFARAVGPDTEKKAMVSQSQSELNNA